MLRKQSSSLKFYMHSIHTHLSLFDQHISSTNFSRDYMMLSKIVKLGILYSGTACHYTCSVRFDDSPTVSVQSPHEYLVFWYNYMDKASSCNTEERILVLMPEGFCTPVKMSYTTILGKMKLKVEVIKWLI